MLQAVVTDGSIRLWAEEETPAAEDLPELDTWVSGCPGLREPLPSAVCMNEIPYLKCPHGIFGCKIKSQATEAQSRRV